METASPPAATSALRPWLVAAGLWLGLAAVVALTLWHLRQEALGGQGRELSLLSLASTDAVERGLRGVEEGLLALRAEVEDERLALGDAAAPRALQARAGLMPLVQTLWVLDARGRPVADTGTGRPPALAGFAPPLQTLAHDGVALGRAASQAAPGPSDDSTAVALAVRVGAPGADGGWIVAALSGRALLGALGAAPPSADTSVVVVRADGARLATVNAAGLDDADLQAATAPQRRPGLAVQPFADGRGHLVAVQSIPRYGLRVLVSRGVDGVLVTWRQTVELAVVALIVVLLVMSAAVRLVQRAERRRAEAQAALQAQVARAGKLESLGTLAGGVAHDFNNVLAGIVGYGEMARDAAAAGSAQARHLDRLMQAARRGTALVERILAFSRGGATRATVFELEPVIEEVLALLAASLRAGIVLERLLEAPGARLKGDPTQAFEAVMNLCTNALQAMPDGGMLSVRLARAPVTRPRVLSHTRLAPGRYLALTVADQGGGISPAVMEHLFEPFFTTRAAQSGTGLGLAVVFGVVAELGGAIDVRSEPGRGARFTLYLPECADGVVAPAAEAQPPRRGAGQRLMVVDDEPGLAALAVETLQSLGYEAEGFTDPALALQALCADPGRFAAVVTDEVMPGLSGTQLTQAVRRTAPQLPVLLVSGYGGALLARRASEAGVSRVLAKPVQRAGLAAALAEMLHGG